MVSHGTYIYIVKKMFYSIFTCHDLGGWNKMHHLCQPINHNKNGVVTFRTWGICDEIHRKI
jgi:hypothetical protein